MDKIKSIKDAKLTSYEDLVSGFRTCIVETSSGKKFEVQSVSPGDLLLFAGSPLVQKLTQAGVDIEDKAAVAKHIDGWEPEEQVKTVTDPDFLSMVKGTVAAGVLSVNFVGKLQRECDPSLFEVSLSRLSAVELFQLFTAIMLLSVSEEEVMDFYSFREESEDVQINDNKSIQSGEDIPSETIADPVPEQEEPDLDAGDRQPSI